MLFGNGGVVSDCGRVVVGAVVVGVEELFEPLDELEVVLEARFYEAFDGDVLKVQRAS